VDIVVDDVSTVENYRSSFNRIIKKEGMDGCIARLNGTGKVVDSGGSKGSSRDTVPHHGGLAFGSRSCTRPGGCELLAIRTSRRRPAEVRGSCSLAAMQPFPRS
jgi:hypothetical protein